MGAKLEGVYRKDIYELPPDSIRELIINAVMNCSFLQNSHIQVAVYDNRLEITSPGGLMPGVTLERMKEGYSQIRNEALAYAFSYMNLIEHWGSGIPRIIGKVKAAGLREPEFIGGEVDLRINIYRGQIDDASGDKNADKVPDSTGTVPDSANMMPDNADKVPDTIERLPDNEQERKIYQYILENGFTTTSIVAELLEVKQRRARAILQDMVEGDYLRKEGAARRTIYVNNMEGR